jgi:hypothetical protein
MAREVALPTAAASVRSFFIRASGAKGLPFSMPMEANNPNLSASSASLVPPARGGLQPGAEQALRRKSARKGQRVWDNDQRGKEKATRKHQKCAPAHNGELRKQQGRGNEFVENDRLEGWHEGVNSWQLNIGEGHRLELRIERLAGRLQGVTTPEPQLFDSCPVRPS